MSKWRLAASSSVVMLGLMLTACGGGGTSGGGGPISTPPPAPSPSPSPSPTPTPTPTPVPTPTPTPTPAATNDDLVAPLVSETFSNDAVKGTASYPSAGSGTATATQGVMTVSYDAGSNSYTVSSAGFSQTFRATDRDASLSAGDGEVFVRTSGNTSDSLFLTRNAIDPGTRSNPRYRYVGGGIWQRTVTAASGVTGTIDAFAYGVKTPDAVLPRTGTAEYPVQLYGVAAFGDTAVAARGSGALTVNFGTNNLTGAGVAYAIPAIGREGDRRWSVTGSISSTANAFSGTFAMGVPFGGAIDATGQIFGRFYGPAAEELGASWFWRDSFLGTTFAGVMLGKDARLFPANTSGLAGLTVDEDLADEGLVYETRIDTTNGANFNGGEPNPHPDRHPDIRYAEASQSYVLDYLFWPSNQAVLAANRDATASNSDFDVYRFTQGNETNTVRVFKPGSGNTQIALTYTGFASWTYDKPDILTYVDRKQGWIAFGQATPAGAIPTTGTASYSAQVFGMSDNAKAADGTFRSYDVTGTASLAFDFAAGSLSGSMHPFLTDPKTTMVYDLGNYAFIDTVFGVGSPTFRGGFSSATFPFSSHFFNGQFSGPAAQELFGRWQTATTDPAS